jgi:predicted RNase H-like HicB family nuclease
MAQIITIAVKLLASSQRDEEAGVFVSRCPALNIFSQGETEDEAKAAIEEAVTLHLKTAYRFDRLHQLLVRAGFEMVSGSPLASFQGEYVAVTEVSETPMRGKSTDFEIEIPLTLVAAAAANTHHQLHA